MSGDGTTGSLWRVTVNSLFPNDQRVENVYEGYHADEAAACDAALFKEAADYGGSTLPIVMSIEKVDRFGVATPATGKSQADDLANVILAGIERDGDLAAREHLAAGRPIYYAEDDTPEGLLLKKHPDGRRELVRYRREGDEVIQTL